MIYLAVPYTHEKPHIRNQRFLEVNAYAAHLFQQGQQVFSPISQCHPIALAGTLPTDWKFWEPYNRKIMCVCTELQILCLPGWDESHGVRAETDLAVELGLKVSFVVKSDGKYVVLNSPTL